MCCWPDACFQVEQWQCFYTRCVFVCLFVRHIASSNLKSEDKEHIKSSWTAYDSSLPACFFGSPCQRFTGATLSSASRHYDSYEKPPQPQWSWPMSETHRFCSAKLGQLLLWSWKNGKYGKFFIGIAVFKLEFLRSYQGNYNAFYLLLWSLVCLLGNVGIIVIEKSNDAFKIKIIGVINDKPVEHQLFNMNCSPIHNRQTIWQQRPWFLWILPQNNPLTKILEIFNSINLHSHFLRESCGFIQ